MNASTNTFLKVPFNEKDQAKALGARWNAELKQWYVPQGVDSAPFEKWFTNSPAPASTPTKIAAKSSTPATTAPDAVFDDDMDAINAKLRDAYELREMDAF